MFNLSFVTGLQGLYVCNVIFGHIHKIAKYDHELCHVCSYVWNNLACIGWIFMKFDIEVFFKNLSRKFKFH